MPKVSLQKLVNHCDRLLQALKLEDYPGAENGLQVANPGHVTRIAAAVDGTLATVNLATRQRADLLLVHHWLFWSPSHPWTGKRYELIKTLLDNSVAVYSSHLPLDAHPRLGNNAQLCAALGLRGLKPFFFSHGRHIGWKSHTEISRADLVAKLERAVNARALLIPGGKEPAAASALLPAAPGAISRKPPRKASTPSSRAKDRIGPMLWQRSSG